MILLASGRRAFLPAVLLASILLCSAAPAEEPCGLCNEEVRLTPPLAGCFLDRYEEIAKGGNGAVVVDLTPCEKDRSVVEALPTPGDGAAAEPDMQFIVTRAQLSCLKARLEARPTFDGVATFDLKAC